MELYLAIFFFGVSTGITPGPNNIMLMTSGMNFGIKRSIPHVLGICVGFPVMIILIGLGFSIVFEKFPILHEVIKILGLVYLLYLSWLIANASPDKLESKESKPFTFLQAALFQWVNPKAWVVATSSISAYTTLEGNIYSQVFIIAISFFFAAIIATSTWLVFGKGIKQVLQSTKQQRIFNISMAALLVASVFPVIQEVYQYYIR
jgi:threonine/homoserine/homoserine lactone efflux protein|tara:strand:+ start:1211 stop:1825 length:615 start_codon:yes stop_codon:yes gene_type:complete